MLGSSVAALGAVGLTTLTNARILNSTVDNTPIGNQTPSNATFSSLVSPQITAGPAAAPFNWIQLFSNNTPIRRGISTGVDPAGDFDFWASSVQNNSGFFFKDSAYGGTWGSITSGGFNGTFNGTFLGGYAKIASQVPSGLSGASQAGYIGWNHQVGRGETDFINLTPSTANAGGFSFYQTTNTSNPGIQLFDIGTGYIHGYGSLQIDNGATISGNLNTNTIAANSLQLNGTGTEFTAFGNASIVGSLGVGGGITGTLNGNASTASALAATPTTCTDTANNTYRMTGISANGNAICTPGPMIHNANTSGCSTGGNSYNTCPVNVSFTAFADTNYSIACTAQNPGGTGAGYGGIAGYTNKSSNGFTVIIATYAGGVYSVNGVDCTMTHN